MAKTHALPAIVASMLSMRRRLLRDVDGWCVMTHYSRASEFSADIRRDVAERCVARFLQGPHSTTQSPSDPQSESTRCTAAYCGYRC